LLSARDARNALGAPCER